MVSIRFNKALPAFVAMALLSVALLPAVNADDRQTEFGGLWGFDDGSGSIAYDEGDYGNDGNIFGATWADGVIATGLAFDGDDYVIVPDSSSMEAGSEDFTLSLWFRTSSSATQMLVNKWDSTAHGFLLRLNDDSTITWLISDGANVTGNSTAVVFDDDVWHNVMMIRDSMYDEVTLYFDGDELGSEDNITGDLVDTDTPLMIGKPSWAISDQYFVGSMDEVIFENSAMSGFYVWYYWYIVSSYQYTIGFWPYDEDLGSVVEDYSPNDNNGTATGLSYVDGVDFMAGRFDGQPGHFTEVTHSPTLNFEGSFSVILWIRTNETGQAQDLVTKYSTYAPNTGFYTRLNPSGGSQGQEGAFVFSVNPNQAYRASSVSVCDGEWHFCVGVFNTSAGAMDVYVDGELKNGPLQGIVPSSVTTNTRSIKMGDGYRGDMDEVIILSRALSAAEVLERYLSYDVSRPPIIDDLGEFTALEDQESVFYLTGYLSDPDTPVEYLEVWTDSDNCTVSGHELHFSYDTGGFDEVVTVYVTDYDTTKWTDLLVHVQEVNDAPVISGIPTQRLEEDEVGVVDLSSYISDEETPLDNLTLWCEHPSMMEIQGFCMTFFFPTPVERQRVNVSVYDGATFTYANFNIEVSEVNDPPSITNLGGMVAPIDIVMDEGTIGWYDITVTDEDDDTFEYEMETEWGGFTVFDNGTLRVSSAKGNVGDFNGTLTVSDRDGLESSILLNVTVVNVNEPPTVPLINMPMNGTIFTKGDQVNFSCEVTDPDQPLGDVLTVTWTSSLDGLLGQLTHGVDPDINTTELSVGLHEITVRVTDGAYAKEATVSITVKKAPSTASEGFLSSTTTMIGIAALVAIVLIGVIVMLMYVKKQKETVPEPTSQQPYPGGPPPAGGWPPPTDGTPPPAAGTPPPAAGTPPPAAGTPAPVAAGAPPAAGGSPPPVATGPAPTHAAQAGDASDVVVDVPVVAGLAGPSFPQQEGQMDIKPSEAQAQGPTDYIPPPVPGTWAEKSFAAKDMNFPGPPVELPKGEEGKMVHSTGVFQANPNLTPITLQKMDENLMPVMTVDEEAKKADREAKILALSNTILRIPGGLNRRLMSYDMWDLAEKVVDGEKTVAPNGKPMIAIDGRQYYADPDDISTFLQDVEGEEEEDRTPPKKKAPKKAKSAKGDQTDAERQQEMLEKLDQRLIDGDISETTYERLRKKYGGD